MISGAVTMLGSLADLSLRGAPFRLVCMQELGRLDGYDWCGVYRLEDNELVLDEYVGASTDHVRIPVGVGVCGTAVATGKNQVVDDVRSLDNYLACSLETRSEIVVLIRKGDAVLGQIDIDSHQPGRFTRDDEHLLEALAGLIAERWTD